MLFPECMLSVRQEFMFKCAIIFEQTICSSNVHGTQVRVLQFFSRWHRKSLYFRVIVSMFAPDNNPVISLEISNFQ